VYNTVVLSKKFGITALKRRGHMCNDFVEVHGFVTVWELQCVRSWTHRNIVSFCDFLVY